MNSLINLPIFQSIFLILPEVIFIVFIISLVVYGLITPMIAKAGDITENYSVYFSWIVILCVGSFLILTISNLTVGFEGYLFSDQYVTTNALTVWKILLAVSFISVLVLSLEYQKYDNLAIFEYSLLFLIAFLAMLLLICSNSFISFYLALEAQSLTLYVLAGFSRKSELSTESAIKYFILGVLASGILLLGITFIYMSFGTLNFVDLEMLYATPGLTNSLSELGVVMVTIALMFKLAAAPFHVWSPDVYEGAPMPSTIFFATVVKLTSIIITSRLLFDVFAFSNAWYPVVGACAFFSFIFGAFGTLQQTKVKRFVAYSGITNIGFFLLCFVCVKEVGLNSLFIYSIIYFVTVFGFIGVVVSLLDSRGSSISPSARLIHLLDFSLLLKKNTQLGIAVILFLFSMAGIPPVAGFFAKLYVLFAVINNNGYFLAMFALLASVLSSYYYIRIIKIVSFSFSSIISWRSFKTPSREISILISLCLLFICVYGFYPDILSGFLFVLSNSY